MDRRIFLSALCASLACASAGYAASYEDSVVSQLRAQGYGKISIERTLLGRVRILAQMGATKREIILNPRTGEILRDIVLDAQGNIAPQIAGNSTTGNSSGTTTTNESRPDDPDENEEVENGSGHGSSGGDRSQNNDPDQSENESPDTSTEAN